MNDESVVLSPDEAIAMLPEGDHVHTFLGGIGCDWPRPKIVEALRKADRIVRTSGLAAAMGHGMYLADRRLFIETKRPHDA